MFSVYCKLYFKVVFKLILLIKPAYANISHVTNVFMENKLETRYNYIPSCHFKNCHNNVLAQIKKSIYLKVLEGLILLNIQKLYTAILVCLLLTKNSFSTDTMP